MFSVGFPGQTNLVRVKSQLLLIELLFEELALCWEAAKITIKIVKNSILRRKKLC